MGDLMPFASFFLIGKTGEKRRAEERGVEEEIVRQTERHPQRQPLESRGGGQERDSQTSIIIVKKQEKLWLLRFPFNIRYLGTKAFSQVIL